MPVPDTNTFSLQDVTNAINPTTNDIVDCFDDAVYSKFDSTYNPNSDGSSTNLLNFRNYDSGSSSIYIPISGGQSFHTTQVVSQTISTAILVGDLILFTLLAESYIAVSSPPSGYTFGVSHVVTNQTRLYLYYKIAVSSDIGSTVSITTSGTSSKQKVLSYQVVRNQKTSSPVGVTTNVTLSNSLPNPSLTGITAGSIVYGYFAIQTSGSMTVAASSGTTLDTRLNNYGSTSLTANIQSYLDSTGGTDKITSVTNNVNALMSGVMIEIKA